MIISENFKRFQWFNFEKDFLESDNPFQKTGLLFLVESTKIEKTSFPYKTAISEANVKTIKIVTIKWTYLRVLPVTNLFLENLFQFKNLL